MVCQCQQYCRYMTWINCSHSRTTSNNQWAGYHSSIIIFMHRFDFSKSQIYAAWRPWKKNNMTTNSRVHPSLHQNCYHQIKFAKIKMKYFALFLISVVVWDYSNSNIEAMNLAIESFNWRNAFDGKDIHA